MPRQFMQSQAQGVRARCIIHRDFTHVYFLYFLIDGKTMYIFPINVSYIRSLDRV